MSATDEVASLKLQIQEFENREKATQQKLQEEHAQLVNFQKKLSQAGNHLKTLAQENSTLNKSLTEVKRLNQELETLRHDDNTKVAQLENDIKSSKEGHQREIKQLVDILETIAPKTMDSSDQVTVPVTVPDVSTSTLLDSYIKSVQKRLVVTKTSPITQDEGEIEQMKKEIQDLKSIDNIEIIQNSLQCILDDPENGSVDNSLPLSLLLILEKVRSTLQDQQENIKHASKLNESITAKDVEKDLKRQITQLNMTTNELNEERDGLLLEKEEMESQIALLENKLIESENEREASQEREKQLSKEHQSLLGKLSHIKGTLTPRLEQDKQLRQKVIDLTQQLEITTRELEQNRSDMMMRDEECSSQMERQEEVINELSSKLEKVQREREEYQVMAMQLDAQCSQIQEQMQEQIHELNNLKTKFASEQIHHESERASLVNLQTVLEEFQATKDAEMQAAVEHIERQLAVAKKSWAEYEERAHTAESTLEKYQQDVGKTQKYEKEIKEKNLLIGKLRHEAIILNEHLVEAMRKLKEETSENNVDRQLITNLLVGFFIAPRGDRKRFDILSIIANVLELNDEQREQIGLLRPSSRSNNVNNLSSPTSPIIIDQPLPKESFTDAWISFLLKESSPLRRNRSDVTLSSSNLDDNIEL